MTSNAGTTLKAHGFGFGREGLVALENRVHTVLQEMFRPEFLNRVDEIIVFEELSREEIRAIVELMLDEVRTDLAEKCMTLVVSDKAKEQLALEGYDPKYGARPLRKTIQRQIEDPLADLFLSGKLQTAVGISVDFEKPLDKAAGKDEAADEVDGDRHAVQCAVLPSGYRFSWL